MFANNPVSAKSQTGAVLDTRARRYLPGVTDTLREAFYPTACESKATQGPAFNVYENEHAEKFEIARVGPARRPGLHTGRRVDHEITHCIKNNVPPASYQREAIAFFMSLTAPRNGRPVLEPKEAQLPVGDPTIPLGTRLDVVCTLAEDKKTTKKRVVIIEVKTGFKGYLHRHTGVAMKAPLEAFVDSPHHQHHLQLAVSCHLFRCTFPHIDIEAAFVVYLSDSTAVWVRLHAGLQAQTPKIVAALSSQGVQPPRALTPTRLHARIRTKARRKSSGRVFQKAHQRAQSISKQSNKPKAARKKKILLKRARSV